MNSNKICFVLNQYGSLFYLAPVLELLKKKKIKNIIFSDLNLNKKKIFKKKFFPVSLKKISKYKIIITDAVVKNKTCQQITNLNDNYVIQFLDGWSYVEERFKDKGKVYCGKEIWTLDNLTKNKIKKITKSKSKIFNVGHPGFESFLKKKRNTQNIKKKILIVLQNFKELNFNLSQYRTINYFESLFSKMKKKYNYYYLLHPGSDINEYKNLKNIIRFKNDYDVLKYTHVIGYFSTIIILSFLSKIKTGVLYDEKRRVKGVENLIEKFKIKKLKSRSEIENFLNSKFYLPKNVSIKVKSKYEILNRILKIKSSYI